MISEDNTPVFKNIEPSVFFELDYGLILKEQADFEKQKSTDAIPRTVAHFVSPQVDDVAFSKETAAQHMKAF